jgi:hypothetical protein
MNSTEPIDALAFTFFREFARCEYCLKVVGLRDPNRKDPTADWGSFAAEVLPVFDTPQSTELAIATNYYLTKPPKKQVVHGEILAWEEVQPDHKSKAELVLRLVCRVRNNLFHGGKFNGQWFAPQRSEELLTHGLTILSAVVAAHSKVREAYAQKAA